MPLHVTYVARSFLDYRIPVFEKLSSMLDGNFSIIYSSDYIPERVNDKVKGILGDRAIGLMGERRIGPDSIQGFANRTFRFVYQPGIIRSINETKPDVLIGDGFYQWTSFALAYRLRYKTPLVVCYERTFHTERHVQKIRTLYRQGVSRFIDAMAVNGKLSLEYTKYLGMPEDRITTGQMVADVEDLKAKAFAQTQEEKDALRKKWGNEDIMFIIASQLIERKGLRELLQAWRLLEKTTPGSYRLVLVGGGSLEGDLQSTADTYGLNQVSIIGAIDYDQIASYYAAADVFVMPTLEDNWSLVVPEAMACGLPVLCSKYNGCYPELIESGGNGWVFDPLDEQDTFLSLKRCVENREDLKMMGARSRVIVAEHTPEHAAEAILEACRKAIAHRNH